MAGETEVPTPGSGFPYGYNPFDALEAAVEHLGCLRGIVTARTLAEHRDAAEEALGRVFQSLCILLPDALAAYEGEEA